MESRNSKTISRRKMMLSSTAAVTGMMVCSTSFADDIHSECEYWSGLIGRKFTISSVKSSQHRTTVTLVGVEEFTAPDPARPAHLRTPFVLIFKPNRSVQRIPDGITNLSCPGVGRHQLFVNEVLNTNYSDQPVIQAAFN